MDDTHLPGQKDCIHYGVREHYAIKPMEWTSEPIDSHSSSQPLGIASSYSAQP